MENREMRRIHRFMSVHATWHHDRDRRRIVLHHANLDRGRMRPEQRRVLARLEPFELRQGQLLAFEIEIKGVMHIPRWVVGWDVQRVKIIEFTLDFRAICYDKTESSENTHEIFHHTR